MTATDIVPGRSCANCTLCCKVLAIPELRKPRGQVCEYCAWTKGCTVYAKRPGGCRDFDCSYLLSPALGEEWKPTTAHMVLGYRAQEDIILIFTDPDYPGMWRTEPYATRVKKWAGMTDIGYVLIWESGRALALVGQDEFDLGTPGDDQVIVRENQPDGRVKIGLVTKP